MGEEAGCKLLEPFPVEVDVEVVGGEGSVWKELVDPSEGQLAELGVKLRHDELPKVEKRGEAVVIVVRTPNFQGPKADVPFKTQPVWIILRGDGVVTVSREKHNLLAHLSEEERATLAAEHDPVRVVLAILRELPHSFVHPLSRINAAVEKLEERLEKSLENREVLQLLRYQKSLVYFTTALRTNFLTLQRLKRREFLSLGEGDANLLDDVLTEVEEAIQVCAIASEILSSMMDAFASIISNNLNVVIKLISALALILVVPATIASFYGMNVDLPMADHTLAFHFVVGLSVVGSLVTALVLRKMRWI